MAGALMQLVAYGAQDVYLTADPTVTFWKAVYRRHTNFAMESMSQTLSGTANFGSKVVCRISRNGDLLHRCYVKATLPSFSAASADDAYVNRVGFALLKSVELRVGGQQIDKHYSSWMHIWSELTHNVDMKALLDKLVGPKGVDGANYNDDDTVVATPPQGIFDLNIPLLFSFCRNPGLALPLIALQYHEIELWIEFETLANVFQGPGTVPTTNNSLSSVELWADYIFLDTEERKEFAQKPHEYLIEVTQQQQASVTATTNNSIRLTFNHPTKFITWAVTYSGNAGDKFTNFCDATGETSGTTSNVNLAKIRLNGQDRFTQRDNTYFNYVQPYQHFECKPDLGINVYSFALKPAEHQPSGSCNLSRIDNVNLEITPVVAGNIDVYAFSYNVFRVASGMGGLAYSN
jgi:hypothetical protein